MKMADSPPQIVSLADYKANSITQIISRGTAQTKAVPALQPVNDTETVHTDPLKEQHDCPRGPLLNSSWCSLT